MHAPSDRTPLFLFEPSLSLFELLHSSADQSPLFLFEPCLSLFEPPHASAVFQIPLVSVFLHQGIQAPGSHRHAVWCSGGRFGQQLPCEIWDLWKREDSVAAGWNHEGGWP